MGVVFTTDVGKNQQYHFFNGFPGAADLLLPGLRSVMSAMQTARPQGACSRRWSTAVTLLSYGNNSHCRDGIMG